MRKVLIITCILIATAATAQRQTNHNIFPQFGNFQNKGWLINPMVTYTLKSLKNAENRLILGPDSIYDFSYSARGKMGVGIEIGRFYAIENSRILSYVDFNLGVKILKGVEEFEATLVDSDRVNPYIRRGEGVFNHTYATASFNATNARKFSKNFSLHNSLGINGDFRLKENVTYNNAGFPLDLQNPERFVFQAHYKIGLGFTLARNIYLIPSVETPILTFYQYDDLKSTLAVFNSRYRPLLFRLTIMVLDNKPERKCPTKNRPRKNSTSLFGMTDSKSPW